MAVTEMDPIRGAFPSSSAIDSVYRLDYVLAFFTLRLALGVNELMHGITRIFMGMGLSGFLNFTQNQFKDTPLPVWQVRAFATVVPCCELIIGALLILGLWTRWALALAALLMVGIIFGTALRSDWQLVFLQMFYSLHYAMMLMWRRYDLWSVDARMSRK
jgi:thiosulfate dehydrogenase [quinone] large subunit